MEEKSQGQFNWHPALSALAMVIGVIGTIDTPATAAAIKVEDSIKVAQVGIRSRINSPTPLNLRPRTHIPLPRRSYRRHYNHHHYHHHHHDNDSYDRHYQHNTYRKRRSHKDKVIIINPGNLSDYGRYNYIRVIGR